MSLKHLILIGALLSFTSCGPLPCRQNHLRAFLDKHASEVLKLAHPTAQFQSAALIDSNAIQIKYQELIKGRKDGFLLTVRFQMSQDYTHINGLAANDTGNVSPFSMSDFSGFMALIGPILRPQDKKSLSQFSPRQMTARYFDQKWQNYRNVFPCK